MQQYFCLLLLSFIEVKHDFNNGLNFGRSTRNSLVTASGSYVTLRKLIIVLFSLTGFLFVGFQWDLCLEVERKYKLCVFVLKLIDGWKVKYFRRLQPNGLI